MNNIIMFLFIAFVLGFIISITITNEQAQIFIFGITIFLTALIFPKYVGLVDSSGVDLIYYGSAILAAIILFISTEVRINKINLESEITAIEVEIANLSLQLAETKKKENQIGSRIKINAEKLERFDPIASISREYFLSNEKSISTKIFEIMKFERLEPAISRRKEECIKTIREASKFIDEQRGIRRDFLGRPTSNYVSSKTMGCSIFNTFYRSVRFDGDYTYRQIGHLLRYSRSDGTVDATGKSVADKIVVINEKEVGLPALLNEVSVMNTEAILKIESPFSARQQREDLIDLVAQYESDKLNVNSEISNIEKGISAKERDLTILNDGLRKLSEKRLQGLTLVASVWLTFWWPYLLISLLGLKIARKQYI